MQPIVVKLRKIVSFWILFISTMVVVVFYSFSRAADIGDKNNFLGSLRVHPDNPRYFTDGTGKLSI